ncbi:hypothetical protein GCM10023238_02600 [Streptomyces heliomycini]
MLHRGPDPRDLEARGPTSSRATEDVYEERIYDASPGELIALLNETPDDAQNVPLIAQPGRQGLADILAARRRATPASA